MPQLAERPTQVLVIDDDDDVRESVAEILADQGYQTATASNGQEALEYLHQHPPPDVILLDLMMPVMSGDEFRAMQRHDPDPAIASIPVVVVSANDEARRHAEQLGARAFLRKPMNLDTLIDTIDLADSTVRARR